MSSRTLAIGLIILGVLILAVVFLAGPLGLAGNSFGIKHIIGVVVGAIVLVVGVILTITRRKTA